VQRIQAITDLVQLCTQSLESVAVEAQVSVSALRLEQVLLSLPITQGLVTTKPDPPSKALNLPSALHAKANNDTQKTLECSTTFLQLFPTCHHTRFQVTSGQNTH
jgi:hypothetical protein